MSGQPDTIIAEEKILDDWLGVFRVTARLNGQEVTRLLIEHPSGSVVLPYDPDRRVAMIVRQTRLPVLRSGLAPLREPVAGACENERPDQTAIRECLEETGIRLRHVQPIAEVWMDPSSSTERAFIFLAEYSSEDRVGSGGGAEGELEDLRIKEESLAVLWQAVTEGEPTYANLLICLQALRLMRSDLFDV